MLLSSIGFQDLQSMRVRSDGFDPDSEITILVSKRLGPRSGGKKRPKANLPPGKGAGGKRMKAVCSPPERPSSKCLSLDCLGEKF